MPRLLLAALLLLPLPASAAGPPPREESRPPGPAAPASRAALLERVTLDLAGRLPTRAESAAFGHDSSLEAYEKLIDRLLASPEYGERQAQRWLDLARAADQGGPAEKAGPQWRYREYVIKAFNEEKAFDRFALDQLAGDLLTAGPDEVVPPAGPGPGGTRAWWLAGAGIVTLAFALALLGVRRARRA